MVTSSEITQLTQDYNTPVPRYTSYPTAVNWSDDFDDSILIEKIKEIDSQKGLSLYVHVPFCEERCLFCGCNVIIDKRQRYVQQYIEALHNEIENKLSLVKNAEKLNLIQLHFGGGTPNYLKVEELEKVIDLFSSKFDFSNIEISIELDPVFCDANYLKELKSINFTRVSFGVQDINTKVLTAINRPQKIDHISQLIASAKELAFNSINLDFIYGLPYQTRENFQNNIDFLLKTKPHRIALFSYAHIPWMKRHQKQMPSNEMPSAQKKLALFIQAREQLIQAGYVDIGIDHFALPDDELSIAFKENILHRNFMGYTTGKDTNMLSFGPSAISDIDGVFAQNHISIKSYLKSCDTNKSYSVKGYSRTPNNIVREKIISQIMNQNYLDITSLDVIDNDLREILERVKPKLENFAQQGLLTISNDGFKVSEKGRFIVRHIAFLFDESNDKQKVNQYSKAI